jgi:hypothetical protein
VIGHINGLWNTSKGGALVTFGGSCSGSAGIGPFLLIENIPFFFFMFTIAFRTCGAVLMVFTPYFNSVFKISDEI